MKPPLCAMYDNFSLSLALWLPHNLAGQFTLRVRRSYNICNGVCEGFGVKVFFFCQYLYLSIYIYVWVGCVFFLSKLFLVYACVIVDKPLTITVRLVLRHSFIKMSVHVYACQ